jgi:DNA-binding NarL/FixJ family response regulator
MTTSPDLTEEFLYPSFDAKFMNDRIEGQTFPNFVEIEQKAQQAELRAQRSQLQATQAQQQATQAQQRATQAEQSLQEAAPRLLSLGLSAKQVADSLGLSVETVQAIADSDP